MAERRSRLSKFTDSLGLEIDRLIKTLPGADPKLRGDPQDEEKTFFGSRTVSPTGVQAGAGAAAGGATASTPADRAAIARRNEFIGAWLRTFAALGLSAAVLFWPYAHDCGLFLHLYLGVVAAVLVSGFWATWSAWRLHLAVAHALSLLVVFWGIVLAAEQLLPRIGYEAVEAAWRCGG